LFYPYGVAVDAFGNLFIADTTNQRIQKVSASGIITTVAGNGTAAFSGDGGLATAAQLNNPGGAAVDGSGNLFIADSSNNRIRKVSASGIITTVAGNGTAGFGGDGGLAMAAQLNNPEGVVVDGPGNLFIADTENSRIRKVSASGIITTVAGSGVPGEAHFEGDGGLATAALLGPPGGVAVDAFGNLFIADLWTQRIRKVSASGIITTIAGNGLPSFGGYGGPATAAALNGPRAISIDAQGNVVFSDGNQIATCTVSSVVNWLSICNRSGSTGVHQRWREWKRGHTSKRVYLPLVCRERRELGNG
jgi:sugar lactone lactonase YvrE